MGTPPPPRLTPGKIKDRIPRERYWWEQGQGRPRGHIKKKKKGEGSRKHRHHTPRPIHLPGIRRGEVK